MHANTEQACQDQDTFPVTLLIIAVRGPADAIVRDFGISIPRHWPDGTQLSGEVVAVESGTSSLEIVEAARRCRDALGDSALCTMSAGDKMEQWAGSYDAPWGSPWTM